MNGPWVFNYLHYSPPNLPRTFTSFPVISQGLSDLGQQYGLDYLLSLSLKSLGIVLASPNWKIETVALSTLLPRPQRTSRLSASPVPAFLGSLVRSFSPPPLIHPHPEHLSEPAQSHHSGWLNGSWSVWFTFFLICFQTFIHMASWESHSLYSTAHYTPRSHQTPWRPPCYPEWLWLTLDGCFHPSPHSIPRLLLLP